VIEKFIVQKFYVEQTKTTLISVHLLQHNFAMMSMFIWYVVCLETTNKFLYRPGKTYEYEFESDITTTIAGTSSEKSSLHLRAVAQLEATSACVMVLRVSRFSFCLL